ncbi:hypothetical protein [Psychrosphaera aestuarii]|uniref:hypothetical protein n=1 Tax=Psychrosphaera aestuarii TaxID=1266052 RepID=UPI001B32359E|nr:hypothetical protein [Psychrosphaera aestuarii]
MTGLRKNVISFVVGLFLSYAFFWFIRLGASAPVPEFLREFTDFSVNYYSELVTSFISLLVSFVIVFLARKVFRLNSIQHLVSCILPIVIYLIYLQIAASFALVSFLYAAIPAILITTTIVWAKKKT